MPKKTTPPSAAETAPAETVIVVGSPASGLPKGFPAQLGQLARIAAHQFDALEDEGIAVRVATERDRARFGAPPVDATAFVFKA